jgi:hypothetical protein
MHEPKTAGITTRVSAFAILSLLLLFCFSSIMLSSTVRVAAASTESACSDANVESQIGNTQTGISYESAISLAQSNSTYRSSTANLEVSFSSISDGWTVSSTTCQVSWEDLAVNFYAIADNGSSYTVTVTENPRIGAVYDVQVSPAVYAGISVGNGTTYSGYGVSGDSLNHDQVYGASTYFYQPTVSQPSGKPYCQEYRSGVLNPNYACVLATWTGVASTQYTGPGGGITSGGVVQTGTFGWEYNNSLSDPTTSTAYNGFYENFQTGGGGDAAQKCPTTNTVSAGDEMNAWVENSKVANGTTGDNYYTYLRDWSDGSWICSHAYTGLSSFTPYYANFIAERPGNMSSSSAYSLPKFSTFDFFYDAMATSSTMTGAYSNYNNGYGFGVEMKNSGTVDITTSTMSNYGSGYGDFTETYDSSVGT